MTSDFYNGAIYVLHLEALRNFYFWDKIYRSVHSETMKERARKNRDRTFIHLLDGRKTWNLAK